MVSLEGNTGLTLVESRKKEDREGRSFRLRCGSENVSASSVGSSHANNAHARVPH